MLFSYSQLITSNHFRLVEKSYKKSDHIWYMDYCDPTSTNDDEKSRSICDCKYVWSHLWGEDTF